MPQLMGFDFNNLFKFLSLASPILVSVGMVFSSLFAGDLKGISWLIGAFISQWFVGFFLARVNYHKMYQAKGNKEYEKVMKMEGKTSDDAHKAAIKKYGKSRRPYFVDKNLKTGEKRVNFIDNCSLFVGPFDSGVYGGTTFPSLNAIFHTFTLTYAACCGVFADGIVPAKNIFFMLLMFIILVFDLSYRYMKKCDNYTDILAGIVLGILCGIGWWALVIRPLSLSIYKDKRLLLFTQPDKVDKCNLNNTKFICKHEIVDD